MDPNNSLMIAVMAQAGIPALRMAFAIALIVFVFGGIFIFRKRLQVFDRAPHISSVRPIVRQNREEIIIIVGSAVMLLLVGILHQVWSV